MKQRQLKQIRPADYRHKVTIAFDVAELKQIYNALLIDQLSNEKPDPTTGALLDKIERLLPSE